MRIVAVLLAGCHLLFTVVGELSADEKTPTETRKLVATVLGKPYYQFTPANSEMKRKELSQPDFERWLREYRAQHFLSHITGRVLNEYAIREKLSPSDAEIEALITAAVQKYPGNFGTDEKSLKNLGLRIFWLRASSSEWRTAKALHEKYGGRVGISSFGGHMSFEGRNAVLKEYSAAGDIKFHDAELERAFWEKTRDERFSDVTLRPETVAQHFAVSPWERWIAEQAQKDAEMKDKLKAEPKDSVPASK
jgi:hypothetical protein